MKKCRYSYKNYTIIYIHECITSFIVIHNKITTFRLVERIAIILLITLQCNTRPNHFSSNEVATDPITVFCFVFLTHLNTDALYFRLNLLFETEINLSGSLQSGNIFIKKTFSTLILKAIIACSRSLQIGVKIVKFTSNDKKKYLILEDELK